MEELDITLEALYVGQERLSHVEIHRRLLAADGPADVTRAVSGLPEGEYALEELIEALQAQLDGGGGATGVPSAELTDDDLFRELAEIHRTRHDALRHASDEALARHSARMAELEAQYLLRFPGREIDPRRTRDGARQRPTSGAPERTDNRMRVRTGAEQPWDPQDLAVAEGRDPSPANVARAQRELDQFGAAAIERTVP